MHLEACWECRAELEDLQNTVSECVRYRKNVLARHLPPPPAPWADIYRGFAKIDAQLDEAGFWRRAARAFETPLRHASQWAPVAVALIVTCLILYRFRQTPSVQAAELLRKAIAAADSSPGKPRRIRIRTRDHSLSRLAGAEAKLASSSANADAFRSLQAIFRSAHYDWNHPLSAKSYQAWRDQLPDKRDEVIEERGAYLIRTNTVSGELAAATLKIRMTDLLPVEERLEFRNQEWVEITELGGIAVPAPVEIAAAAGSPASARRHAPPAASVPSSSATISDELRVLAALHQVGADLGDPIEVSRMGGEILVTGVGIAPQRQREIHDALGSQPGVVVRFSDSAPASVEPQTEAPADSTVSVEIQQLQARLAERIGGREYFSQLAAQVLDLSEPMMSRVYALRRLAERFPAEAESELSAQDRRILRGLQREHTEALRRHTAEMERLLKPVLAPAQPDAVISSDVWQRATEELFQSARRVEKLLAVIFGAAAGEPSGEQLPSQLSLSLAQLRARLQAYERINK